MTYTIDRNSYRAAGHMYDEGRGGRRIDTIVVHHWGDPSYSYRAANVARDLCDNRRQVSAHYVASAEVIYNLVDDGDTAWHAGNYGWNKRSIGIESNPRCSEGDKEAVGWLIAQLQKKYGALRIVGHKDIVATGCPGAYYPPAKVLAPYIAKYMGQTEAASAVKSDVRDSGRVYTVQKGDMLYKIAEAQLGDGRRWPDIAKLNAQKNPDKIDVGQKLRLPLRGGEDYFVYTVQNGDMLYKIAEAQMGDGRRWPEIVALNKLPDPDIILPGEKLKIPLKAAPPELKVGDRVRITGTRYATGEEIPDWVKAQTHVVSELTPQKVLLGADGGICSWVKRTEVQKA